MPRKREVENHGRWSASWGRPGCASRRRNGSTAPLPSWRMRLGSVTSAPRRARARGPAIAARPDRARSCSSVMARRPRSRIAARWDRHAGEMARRRWRRRQRRNSDARGLLLLGRVAKIARPRVLLSRCRGIREMASAEVACAWQASSAVEIHLLLEPSIW